MLNILINSSTRAKTIKERIRFCEKNASFDIATLLPFRVGEGKKAAISKQTCLSQKRVPSYSSSRQSNIYKENKTRKIRNAFVKMREKLDTYASTVRFTSMNLNYFIRLKKLNF